MLAGGGRPQPASLAQLTSEGGADDYLDYPAGVTATQQQFCSVLAALGIAPEAIARWQVAPDGLNPFESSRVYAYVTRDASYSGLPKGMLAIQYWVFYPFNYFPVLRLESIPEDPIFAIRLAAGYHEGDFEHVAVLLDPETHAPRYLWMARHAREDVAFPWGDPRVQWDGEHPVVYSGIGGHASYNHCGRQRRPGPTPDEFVLCRDEQLFTFGAETTPLVDLSAVPWSCWPGHFGERRGGLAAKIHRAVSGPRSPLYQQQGAQPCGQ